jgi:hypothetical protein
MNRKNYLNKMMPDAKPSLFTAKEMYAMSTTKGGHSPLYYELSSAERRKLTYNNMHLAVGMGIEYTETNSIPILEPYNGTLEYEYRTFSERRRCKGEGQALMIFEDDYIYKHLLWDRLEQTTATLAKFDCVFTPDFSMYVDAPIHLNRDSIYKSRFDGAYWQKCGFNVIPTASWADVNSFPWCFEGLPQHSVIAVCGVGVCWSRAAMELWFYGVRQVEQLLSPTTIIVYGKQKEIPGISVPVMFIEDYITKHFRNETTRK